MFPIEKYKFYTDNKSKVIAVSTFAGKTVRGIAKCNPQDKFSFEKGKKLAAARCALQVAKKRKQRARERFYAAELAAADAAAYKAKMMEYYVDSMENLWDCQHDLKELLLDM